MAFGVKTNERPGTRAQVKFARFSAYKAREVLDLIRGEPAEQAIDILQFSERDAAITVSKCLRSAVANAEHNDAIEADELYVSACYADEGPTLKRWRPRARGRATRIRKRTCHITVIVSRYSPEELEERRRREAATDGGRGRSRGRDAAAARRRRVARSRGEEEAAPETEESADVDAAEAPAEAAPEEAGASAKPAERSGAEEPKPAKKSPAKKKPAARKVAAKKSTTAKKATKKKATKKKAEEQD